MRPLYLSLVLFVVTILLWGGLLSYNEFLKYRLTRQDQILDQITKSWADDPEKVATFYQQLATLKNLLSNNTSVMATFSFLENTVHPKVTYRAFDVLVPERKATLDGTASSQAVLVKQLELFNQSGIVEQALVLQSKVARDGVDFKLALTLRPEFFKSH